MEGERIDDVVEARCMEGERIDDVVEARCRACG